MVVTRARHGPWAVVTGASSGIGASFARALAARGLDLALVARRAERLESLAEELRARTGVAVLPLPLDLCAPEAAADLAGSLAGREVGLLVNNAGFGSNGALHETDADWLRRMVRLNCEAPVALTRCFLPGMVERRRGGIVFVASTSAYQATPWMAVYGASKAFDLHLAEALAVELAGSGVEVLAVSPGHTASEFHSVAGTGGPVTGGHPADPASVVAATLRLLGRRASFVHGLHNRLLAWSTRLVPRSVAAAGAGRLLARRLPGRRRESRPGPGQG